MLEIRLLPDGSYEVGPKPWCTSFTCTRCRRSLPDVEFPRPTVERVCRRCQEVPSRRLCEGVATQPTQGPARTSRGTTSSPLNLPPNQPSRAHMRRPRIQDRPQPDLNRTSTGPQDLPTDLHGMIPGPDSDNRGTFKGRIGVDPNCNTTRSKVKDDDGRNQN